MTSPGPKPQNYDNRKSWQARPWLGRSLRLAIAAIPLLTALAVTTIFSRLFARSNWSISGRIVWAVAMFVAASLIASIVSHFTERLLPLSALCQMNLAFPETAPGRIKLALRLGNSANGDKVVADFQRHGLTPDPQTAAIETLHLVEALNRHDRRTRGHSERVRALADVIAEEMNLPEDDRNLLRWGSLLHDIGKLSVPAEILNKPGKPTADEWTTLKGHPAAGEWRIKPLEAWLGDFAKCVYQHHERYDGTGYPLGLRGDQMPLGSRIVAVADAFECMTATRSYKKAMSYDDARAELVNCAGTHFDPKVVRAFARVGGKKRRYAAGFLSSWTGELVGSQRSIISAITQGGSPAQVLKLGAEAIKTIGVAAVVSTASAAALPVAIPPTPVIVTVASTTTLPTNLALADDGDYQTEFVVATPTSTVPPNVEPLDAPTELPTELAPPTQVPATGAAGEDDTTTRLATTISTQIPEPSSSVVTEQPGPTTPVDTDVAPDEPESTAQTSTLVAGLPPVLIDPTKPTNKSNKPPTTPKPPTTAKPPTTPKPPTTRKPTTTKKTTSTKEATTSSVGTKRTTTVGPTLPNSTTATRFDTTLAATTQVVLTSPVSIETLPPVTPTTLSPTTISPTTLSPTMATPTTATPTTTTSPTTTSTTTTSTTTTTILAPPAATCWTQELYSNIGLVGPPSPLSQGCQPGFDLMVGREEFAPGLDDNFSARYTAVRTFTGPVTFTTLSDDGVRVLIDGVVVLDNWTIHPITKDIYSTTLMGVHTITVEYFETILDSALRFGMTPEPTGLPLALHHAQVPQRPLNTTDGLFVETFAHHGDAKRTDAANAGLVNPLQMAMGPDGNVYVADDTEGILAFNPSGAIVHRFNEDTGVDNPHSLAFNPVDGLLYFFSRSGNHINALDIATGQVEDWYPTGGSHIDSMVFDNDGNLFAIQDGFNRVRKITPLKVISTVIGGGSQSISTSLLSARPATYWNLHDTYDVAYSAGSLIVSTRDYLLAYNVQTGSLDWLLGNPNGTADGIHAKTFKANVRSVAVLPNGDYAVADQYNGIRTIDASGTLSQLTTPRYQDQTTGDGGDLSNASFGYPIDIVVDPASGIYIAQDGVRSIRRLT